jgi:hypothetical protein
MQAAALRASRGCEQGQPPRAGIFEWFDLSPLCTPQIGVQESDMTRISRKLIAGGLAAGLIALSGATSAFAVPRMSLLPRAHQAQTQDNQTLAVFPAPYQGTSLQRFTGDTIQRDGGDHAPDNPWGPARAFTDHEAR